MTAPALSPRVRLDREATLTCLRFPVLESLTFARHAVTTRLGGVSTGPYASANIGLAVGDERAAVLTNRMLAARLVTNGDAHPVLARQVHGVSALLAVTPGAPGVPLGEGDMLATDVPGVPLLVQAADCVPIVILDPVRRAVAAVHAGWRGTALAAAAEAVTSMARLFGSEAGDLVIGIGPGIGGCCYEVSDEVAAAVRAASPDSDAAIVLPGKGDRPHVDLMAALVAQLTGAGVPADQVTRSGICTACRTDLFYSHRREGEPTGRFAALVCISPTA